MALSRGVPPRPQAFVAQADAQPFAALLDAAAAPAANTEVGDGGAATQDRAGASAGNAVPGTGAPANGARAQNASATPTQGAAADTASDGKPLSGPGVTGFATLASTASVNGTSSQTVNADATHQTTAKIGDGGKSSAMPNTNQSAIAMLVALPSSGGGSANPPSGTSAAAAGDANDPVPPDTADVGKDAPGNTAAAALAAALADLTGAAPENGATSGATKPAAGGKDDDKDQQSGSADAGMASPAASGAPLASPDAAQPVAAAVVVNAAPDAAPGAAAKPGLTIGDAVKTRAKVGAAPVATEQTSPAQDEATDAPDSSVAADSDASNSSPAGADGATADASANNLQQAIDQAPAQGGSGVTLLSQIDFASLGGTQRFALHGDSPASPGGAAGSVGPNGAANTAVTPNFGIFAPGAVAANISAPAAAAAEPAVPLAGLAVAIAGRAQAGSSQFDIRLDPPELGRIDVRLDVDGSGQVRTHVTVDRADTLQLLQSQQPQLQSALEQAGLKTAENGLQFTLRDQSFSGQNGGSGGQQQTAPPLQSVIPDSDVAPINTAEIYARLRFGNGLDIRV